MVYMGRQQEKVEQGVPLLQQIACDRQLHRLVLTFKARERERPRFEEVDDLFGLY